MKNIVWIFVLVSSACLGQVPNHPNITPKDTTPKKHFFISANYGINLPTDDYGTASHMIASGGIQGYAKTGTHANITCAVTVSGNISLLLRAGFDMNSIDNSITLYQYSGGFNILQIMGGISYQVAPSNNTLLRVQALVGYINANYPATTIIYQGLTETDSFQNATGLGYSMGVGFERKLNPTWGLVANLSYTAGYITYPSNSVSINGATVNESTATNMNYGSVEMTVGVALHL